jgi:hypothetical protein
MIKLKVYNFLRNLENGRHLENGKKMLLDIKLIILKDNYKKN